ncbi:MAG: P-loop NTPase fold protein, partial [Patescibacteria group bacterium]
MEQKQSVLISIENPKSDFERFVGTETNKRIFFSGRFGIGKTFFLQKFFETHADKYDTYHLFPVRYQIASNENVVELLKYDILVELLKKYPDAFKKREAKDISGTFKLFAAFCKDKGLFNRFLKSAVETGESVLALSPDPLFQALGKLGRPLNELLSIDKEFQEFKNEYMNGEKGVVEKFIKEIHAEGDVIATDYISHLLVEKIDSLKESKKSVLILDDFDRMDPEHIFRILNVFSAHMEGNEENKFGFDHIIIVGDIHNLQSIFHHRYGEKTEFWGYFDKFFSIRPFYFNNEKAIAESIPLLLRKVKYEDSGLEAAFSEDGIMKGFMHEILAHALAVGKLNVRQLYKPLMHSFPELRSGVYKQDVFMDNWNQCIDLSIKLLIAIYGDKQNFLNVLSQIRESNLVVASSSGNWRYREFPNSMLRHLMPLDVGKGSSWLGKYEI